MSLVGLLATAALVNLASCTPLEPTDAQRTRIPIDRDHLLLQMLLSRLDLGFKKKPPEEVPNESMPEELLVPGRSNLDKRTNSMSVVNSVDVMRERVLLELARRKALEDQRTLGDNRHFLNYVGKRFDKSMQPKPAKTSYEELLQA